MNASRNEQTGKWTLNGVEPSEETFKKMCDLLKEGANFKFARYGDGEFLCMGGKIGNNCDGHEYFPELGSALNAAFYSDPNYLVGIQPLSVQGGLYQRATLDRPGPKHICDADVLHSASIDGKLNLFFEAIKSRHVIMVGPKHLSEFPCSEFVEVPKLNCWLQYDRIANGIFRVTHPDSVVLLCAGMMSGVLIDNFRTSDITMIDCGSVFDPYYGVNSRSYHKKLK